jgi:hypothetical protein
VLAVQLWHWCADLGLLEHGNDLAVGITGLLHGNLLGKDYEKIPLLGSANQWGGYPRDESIFRDLKIVPRNVESMVVNGSGVRVDIFECSPIPSIPIAFLTISIISRLIGNQGHREYVKACLLKEWHRDVVFALSNWVT